MTDGAGRLEERGRAIAFERVVRDGFARFSSCIPAFGADFFSVMFHLFGMWHCALLTLL